MAWLVLVLSGVLESVWAIALDKTEGFTRLMPSVVFSVALIASMAGLAYAMRTLPLGTAYAVWVGIGAFGAAVLGIFLFNEPATPGRLFFLGLMLVSIAGLKASSPDPAKPVVPAAEQGR